MSRDSDGFVTDTSSCDAFTAAGEDNGVLAVVRDSLEYHNMFVGHYTLGDVQFDRYVGVWNWHGMYRRRALRLMALGEVSSRRRAVSPQVLEAVEELCSASRGPHLKLDPCQ